MITNKQKELLENILSGKVKISDISQKYSAYKIRMRKRIDRELENAQWLAENAPDILRDFDFELNDPAVPIHRRLKAILKIAATFESEVKILKLINEMYPDHTIEVVRKKKKS